MEQRQTKAACQRPSTKSSLIITERIVKNVKIVVVNSTFSAKIYKGLRGTTTYQKEWAKRKIEISFTIIVDSNLKDGCKRDLSRHFIDEVLAMESDWRPQALKSR